MARRKYRPSPVDPVRRAAPALGAGSGGRRLLRSLSAQDDHRVNAWKRGSESRELFNRPESLQLGRSIWLGAEILRIWRWFGFPGHTWLLAFERSDAALRCRCSASDETNNSSCSIPWASPCSRLRNGRNHSDRTIGRKPSGSGWARVCFALMKSEPKRPLSARSRFTGGTSRLRAARSSFFGPGPTSSAGWHWNASSSTSRLKKGKERRTLRVLAASQFIATNPYASARRARYPWGPASRGASR